MHCCRVRMLAKRLMGMPGSVQPGKRRATIRPSLTGSATLAGFRQRDGESKGAASRCARASARR